MLEGFELWVPPTSPTYDEDDMPYYEIIGTDAQIVQFPVRAGRKVMCFSGAMAYMSKGIQMDVQLAGFGKTFGRMVGGGSLFQVTYTNNTGSDGYIGMTPDYPGVIVPINMSATGKVVALRDSFLCATVGIGDQMTDVGAGFNPASSALSFCCSGMDCAYNTNTKTKTKSCYCGMKQHVIVQSYSQCSFLFFICIVLYPNTNTNGRCFTSELLLIISHEFISFHFIFVSFLFYFCLFELNITVIVQTVENGEWAFLMAMGTVIKKTLAEGEQILVDGNSILCFETSVTIDVRVVGGIAAMCCGGEGIFNTELSGPGTVFLQSMSIDKLRLLFPPDVQKSGGDAGGGGE
mmetsp:Transcript_15313/g.38587  ORF Transcript_15313/g.38587 Transcript_15313/m.38587 type:complete len:348 (+) Transcript_15313:209-1252(+)